jgi:phospholipid/cholesterol/gamma-HCH transport system permease protein
VYFDYFWRFTNLTDLGFSVLKAAVFALIVITIAVYQGYHARGGAVGIGRAVARTMALSLVLVVVFNAVLTEVFWGHNPNFPIPT